MARAIPVTSNEPVPAPAADPAPAPVAPEGTDPGLVALMEAALAEGKKAYFVGKALRIDN